MAGSLSGPGVPDELDGGFNIPNVVPGVQDDQWNLAYWVVPIPLPFGESVLQASDRKGVL
jgi:hypothetical protein